MGSEGKVKKIRTTKHSIVYHGDVTACLKQMESNYAQVIITSPPYWNARDYEVKGQIGLEKTPEEFIEKMVKVFREAKRVLRDDGLLFLNLGDSRAKKQLLGIPWRVALALQADGWILRSDIIWYNLNPMPESCSDRPTKSHEYLFMLSKNPHYFYDAKAIEERSQLKEENRWRLKYGRYDSCKESKVHSKKDGDGKSDFITKGERYWPEDRNKRDVWPIPTSPYKSAHFATFPPALVEPCILAGTSEKGCCKECGAPWKRIIKKIREATRPGTNSKSNGVATSVKGNRDPERHITRTITKGWEPTCKCDCKETKPCIVMDIFCLHPESQILTMDGVKWAKDVFEGDMLYTHLGRYRKCYKKYERKYEGRLIRINSRGRNLLVTPEHPILTISTNYNRKDQAFRRSTAYKVEWIPAGKINKGDMVSFPIYDCQDVESSISDTLLELIGWFLAEGHAERYAVHICNKDVNVLNRIMELFAEIAPDGARRYDSVRATLSSQRWARFFLQFGNTAPYKRMPLWLKSISLRQMGIMLKSMYKGDGSVMDRTTRKDFTIVYGSSSPSLTYDLAQCLSRYGIFGTISYRRPEQIPLRMLNGSPVIARHTQHSICVGGEASRVLAKLIEVNQPKWKAKATGYWNRDGHLWAKAQKVEEMDYDGSVVNFSVEEDESFVADGIVTHNCGTSTTGMVAIRRGRNYIGIELNAKYIEMSKKRLQQGENRRGFGF